MQKEDHFKDLYCTTACSFRSSPDKCSYPQPDRYGYNCVVDKMRSDANITSEGIFQDPKPILPGQYVGCVACSYRLQNDPVCTAEERGDRCPHGYF